MGKCVFALVSTQTLSVCITYFASASKDCFDLLMFQLLNIVALVLLSDI